MLKISVQLAYDLVPDTDCTFNRKTRKKHIIWFVQVNSEAKLNKNKLIEFNKINKTVSINCEKAGLLKHHQSLINLIVILIIEEYFEND